MLDQEEKFSENEEEEHVVVHASEVNRVCVAAPLGVLSALPRARAANIMIIYI
jgi:hypothetical protein